LGRYIYVLDQGANGQFTARAVYVQEFAQSGDDAVIGVQGLVPAKTWWRQAASSSSDARV